MKTFVDLLWQTGLAVNPLLLPMAILIGLVLAAVAVSFVALFRARTLAREAVEKARGDHTSCMEALELLRRNWSAMASEIAESRQQASAAMAAPQSGLNLSKRSQALRMHRRGDAAGEIASSLGIPLQEVHLLLKVHRIVIGEL